MKKIYYCLVLLLLISCTNKVKNYHRVTKEEFDNFIIVDTLVKKASTFIFSSNDKRFKEISKLVMIKKNWIGNDYYVFDDDCYLENDSTIIAYAPPFKSDSENGSFQKNGIWLYAAFYSDRDKEGNAIYETSGVGVDFKVDSLPNNLKIKTLPIREGIYFYKKDTLISVTTEQSEDKFWKLKKNGFYFIPNTGRLFTRFNSNEIQ